MGDSIKLTFIRTNVKLTKRFKADGTAESYPNRAKITTKDVAVNSLEQFYEAIKEHGQKGYALLKGNTTRPLKNESRRGMTDASARTRWLCIDIDGMDLTYEMPNGERRPMRPEHALEWIQEQLPELKGVACIVQYSASYRITKDTFSAHLFYLLDRPYTPRELKAYLGLCNFEESVKDLLTLTDSKSAIRHVIDPSVADNSKLIYIAPPVCEGSVEDPFPGDSRYQLVSGEKQYLTLPKHKLDYAQYQAQKQKTLKALRTAEGLPTDKRHMPNLIRVADGTIINANPGEGVISVVSYDEQHVRCNVNGGDSQAYWFPYGPISDSTLMLNFKGEEPFLIKQFDPDFAKAWNSEHFPDAENQMPVAFVFRDPARNQYFALEHDPETNLRRINAIDTGQPIKDFYLNRGMPVPEVFEEWSLEFLPPETWFIDKARKRINMFVPSEYLLNKEPFPERITPDNAMQLLQKHCPAHHQLLHHALGSSEEHTARFVNWLACHLQGNHRGTQRVDTAWIIQGAQGTGKTSILTGIVAPMINTESNHYATHRSLKNLDETYNGWIENTLFVEVEEAYLNGMGDKGAALLENVIKPMITDQTVVMRKMRRDQMPVMNHVAYIFTTNRTNPLKIQYGDRRFHVAPRQEVPLKDVVDTNKLFDQLAEERQLFTNYLFDHYADYRDARTVVEDKAKLQLAYDSMSTMEQLGKVLRDGNLWWMVDILHASEPDEDDFKLHGEFINARAEVLGWLLKAQKSKKVAVSMKALRSFYAVVMADRPFKSTQAFSKALRSQTGLEIKSVSISGKGHMPGIMVKWRLESFPTKDLLEHYLALAKQIHETKKQLKTLSPAHK